MPINGRSRAHFKTSIRNVAVDYTHSIFHLFLFVFCILFDFYTFLFLFFVIVCVVHITKFAERNIWSFSVEVPHVWTFDFNIQWREQIFVLLKWRVIQWPNMKSNSIDRSHVFIWKKVFFFLHKIWEFSSQHVVLLGIERNVCKWIDLGIIVNKTEKCTCAISF